MVDIHNNPGNECSLDLYTIRGLNVSTIATRNKLEKTETVLIIAV